MVMDTSGPTPEQNPPPSPTWTYPTRFCRICREDVAPTVTMYPPGVPPRFQKPIVEYRNDDEYGRLIKPCKCTGSMRYIHELCLLRSRTENRRAGSMWKCHTCGYQFNVQKLAVERFLSSKYSSTVLTVTFMLVLMFILGFFADPIINLGIDPYDTLLGHQDLWGEINVEIPGGFLSSWAQHFLKGLVSMGFVGFLQTILLSPWNLFNLRAFLGRTGTRTTTTGRDRVANIGWYAVAIGVISAFYFFYQWVQTVIQISLTRFGQNVVDTQLPGDDDDLKPPPGWKFESRSTEEPTNSAGDQTHDGADVVGTQPSGTAQQRPAVEVKLSQPPVGLRKTSEASENISSAESESSAVLVDSWPQGSEEIGRSSALDGAHSQSWSFSEL